MSASTIHPRQVVKPQLVTLSNRHMVLVALENTLPSPCHLRASMSVYLSVSVVLVCASGFAETSRCCPLKATKATFQGWRALRWGSPTALGDGAGARGLLPVRTRPVYPSLHSVACDPAWPKRMMDAPRLSPTRHRQQLGCGLKEQYSAFPISCSGLRKDISRSQPASQPASFARARILFPWVCVSLCFCSRFPSQLAADARPLAKLCPSAQVCTYRLCRRDCWCVFARITEHISGSKTQSHPSTPCRRWIQDGGHR